MIPAVEPVDAAAIAAAQAELDAKTKPRGSLGRIEALAAQLAGVAGGEPPAVNATVVVAAGIRRDSIETLNFSVYPEYVTDDRGENPRVRGYRVTNQVSLKTRRLDAVGTLIDAALEAGANRVEGISFGLSDPQAAEAEPPAAADFDRRDRHVHGDAQRDDLVVEHERALALGVESPRADVDEQPSPRQSDAHAAAEEVSGRFAKNGVEAFCRREGDAPERAVAADADAAGRTRAGVGGATRSPRSGIATSGSRADGRSMGSCSVIPWAATAESTPRSRRSGPAMRGCAPSHGE